MKLESDYCRIEIFRFPAPSSPLLLLESDYCRIEIAKGQLGGLSSGELESDYCRIEMTFAYRLLQQRAAVRIGLL